jgi:hypothetical protein
MHTSSHLGVVSHLGAYTLPTTGQPCSPWCVECCGRAWCRGCGEHAMAPPPSRQASSATGASAARGRTWRRRSRAQLQRPQGPRGTALVCALLPTVSVQGSGGGRQRHAPQAHERALSSLSPRAPRRPLPAARALCPPARSSRAAAAKAPKAQKGRGRGEG